MIPGSANPLLLKSAAAAGGYQIERSLRFNSSDSAFLSRVVSSAGNRKTFTLSWGLKRSGLTTFQSLFNSFTDVNNRTAINFDSSIGSGGSGDYLTMFNVSGGSLTSIFQTNALFRDASAWYHVVVAVDTTQATGADRVKLWVNNTLQSFSTYNAPAQNADLHWNSGTTHYFGVYGGSPGTTSYGFNGLLADVFFIDGQALTPSSFTETSATTGQLVPIAYTGSYGTNGFHLPFSDNSSNTATTLGKDTSGNGNNWTPNNFSVTAGAGNDSLVDTPTSAGTDTGVGGQVTGNYCTWNPLETQLNLTNGNLDVDRGTSSWASCKATIGLASGKWYYEYTVNSGSSNQMIGVFQTSVALPAIGAYGYMTVSASGWGYQLDGNKSNANSVTGTGTTATAGDVLMVAFDVDAGKIWFGKNGTWIGSGAPASGTNAAFTNLSGTISPAVCLYGAQSGSVNFGARVFAYQAPSGFRPIVDTLLPSPVVAKPSTVMDVVLRTGTGTSGGTISSLNFSADFIWSKLRSTSSSHYLLDSVRGIANTLQSNSTASEASYPTWFTSITSTGYTVGSGDWTSGASVVEWCWDAGSSTVTNTQGSITSQVRANASAGFSVVTWTSDGASSVQTMGHGLGVTPGLIIAKNRSISGNWWVWHNTFSNQVRDYLLLQATDAKVTAGVDVWSTSSTTFGMRQATIANNTNLCVAYCFAPVAGYSSMGSFVGNGSNDGPMLWLGFRPKWFMYKVVTQAQPWVIVDGNRSQSNIVGDYLLANSSDAEGNLGIIDFLSNGVKVRYSGGSLNISGQTYIYAAFAENPFQFSRAR